MRVEAFIRAFLPIGLAAGLGACASARPSPMLVEAREAYEEASTGPANKYAPDLVYEARIALEDAERAHVRASGSEREAHLAYLAQRRALMAMASADERVAHEEAAEARATFETVLVSRRDDAMGEVRSSREEFATETAAREKAEEDARRAMASLARVASVKSDAQRVVITLAGDVLFAVNEATLLPVGQTRLDTVADALKTQGDKAIVINGHSDARGGAEVDQRLSQRRADAVRSYLVGRGVRSDAIKAVGKGKVERAADGRSDDERNVEIVVDAATPGQPPPSQ